MCVTPAGKIGNCTCGMPKLLPHSGKKAAFFPLLPEQTLSAQFLLLPMFLAGGSGVVNEALAHPREILKPAIIHSASAFVVMHNHPSGDPTASDADLRMTRSISAA